MSLDTEMAAAQGRAGFSLELDVAMKAHFDVQLSLAPSRGVVISFERGLEVSLDCATCGRVQRTVVFRAPGERGHCTPDGHSFEGEIGPATVTVAGLWRRTYRCSIPLSYEYQFVADKKYPSRTSAPTPTWARVRFTATCPKCGRSIGLSTQTNMVRPYSCTCPCGKALYTEVEQQPAFSVRVA